MIYFAALMFQIPTEMAVKESNFFLIQELRELLHTKRSFREDISSTSSSIFLNSQLHNKAFISQLVTQNNLVLLQQLYCILLKTN